MTTTPTRLTFHANGDANSYALLDEKGHWFMSMLVNGEQLEAKQEANLRRLAACWNACDGIQTDILERSRIDQLTEVTAPGDPDASNHGKLAAYKIEPITIGSLMAERDDLHDEVTRLQALINTPQTDDYMTAVRLEAAHQVERWGAQHDAGKEPQDWFWLLGYLAGKALHAFTRGDRDKGLHHIISSAAALLNWHRHVTGENTAMRPGIDPVDRSVPAQPAPSAPEFCPGNLPKCNWVAAQPCGAKCTTCGDTIPF